MKKIAIILSLLVAVSLAVIATSCTGGESAETKALYLDAKRMIDEVESAFAMPGGEGRIKEMRRIINEEYDIKIITNLEKYVTESPKGEYIREAKLLLEDAKASPHITALGQARPLLQKIDIPETAAGIDSMTKAMQEEATKDSL